MGQHPVDRLTADSRLARDLFFWCSFQYTIRRRMCRHRRTSQYMKCSSTRIDQTSTRKNCFQKRVLNLASCA